THLEFDWRSPVHRPWLEGLNRDHLLVRFDPRGCGLSERDVADVSFETWVQDLEAVVDAAGLERFILFGASQGGPIAVDYAVRHPGRVQKLVLHGAYARGRLVRASTPRDEEEAETFPHLVPLETRNHILLPSDPAFAAFFTALREFLGGGLPQAGPVGGELTGREREILELIAQGLGNARISQRLGISPNTLRNHITSI